MACLLNVKLEIYKNQQHMQQQKKVCEKLELVSDRPTWKET
jgi:hypothetical protein